METSTSSTSSNSPIHENRLSTRPYPGEEGTDKTARKINRGLDIKGMLFGRPIEDPAQIERLRNRRITEKKSEPFAYLGQMVTGTVVERRKGGLFGLSRKKGEEVVSDVLHTATDNPYPATAKYNPRNLDSMKRFVQQNPHQIKEINGHEYIIDVQNSAIILIPNGDLKNVCQIRFFGNDGKDIGADKLRKAIHVYLDAYNDIQDKMKELGLPDLHITHVKIDIGKKLCLGYHMPTSVKDMSFSKGIRFDLKKETWQSIADLFDESKTESKKHLDGEPVKGKGKHKESDEDMSSLLSTLGKKPSPDISETKTPPFTQDQFDKMFEDETYDALKASEKHPQPEQVIEDPKSEDLDSLN